MVWFIVFNNTWSKTALLLLLLPRCWEQVCQVPAELLKVLLLVPGEVYQVPQQKCIHYGEVLEFCTIISALAKSNVYFCKMTWNTFSIDCHIWQKLLYFCSRRLLPSHEEHCQVGIPTPLQKELLFSRFVSNLSELILNIHSECVSLYCLCLFYIFFYIDLF